MVAALSLSAFANIDAAGMRPMEASEAEIASSRACFHELEALGCGSPHEDREHFRTCMSESFPKLDKSCQELMKSLYVNRVRK